MLYTYGDQHGFRKRETREKAYTNAIYFPVFSTWKLLDDDNVAGKRSFIMR